MSRTERMRGLQAREAVIVPPGVHGGSGPRLTRMRQSIETGDAIDRPDRLVGIVETTSPMGRSRTLHAQGALHGLMAVPA